MQTNKTILAEIAKKHLSIDVLDSRQSDRLDFHDLAVWSIEQALAAAFQAGLDAAEDRRQVWGEELLRLAQNAEALELAYPSRRIFAQVLAAMQDAEEIGGPERSDYMGLMVAIIREASERIACYASHAFEQHRNEVSMTIEPTNHGGDKP
ncbi:MAG TPA: hypothetical protein VFA18_14210 [Gemmataceae bacterium]|jgi:hypothetical protein|nr:hypothetical protein [Gemmataceae bacterium]